MMSYEDLEVAQAKRAVKEVETRKGKRGRKRMELEIGARKSQKARRSELEVAENEITAGGLKAHCSILQL